MVYVWVDGGWPLRRLHLHVPASAFELNEFRFESATWAVPADPVDSDQRRRKRVARPGSEQHSEYGGGPKHGRCVRGFEEVKVRAEDFDDIEGGNQGESGGESQPARTSSPPTRGSRVQNFLRHTHAFSLAPFINRICAEEAAPPACLLPLPAALVPVLGMMLVLIASPPTLAILPLAKSAPWVPTWAPRPIALYTSDVCVGHEPGSIQTDGSYSHPEQPRRLEALLDELRTKWQPEFGSLLQVREPPKDVTRAQMLRVHSLGHVSRLEEAWARSYVLRGQVKLDGADTISSPGTRAAATRAAGLVVAAVDDIFERDSSRSSEAAPQRAFIMARPPGHHAERDKAMGFCFLNNVLIGAAHAEAAHGVGRVAILDFDVHHGNGDEDIAKTQPNRLYVSSHEVPNFPGTGELRGLGGFHKNVLNVPLRAKSGSRAFRNAWSRELLPAIKEFDPECIFVSAGFDAHADDPLSSIRLTDDDFAWLTGEIGRLAGDRVPIISVLEGGYNVDRLKTSVRRHIRGLITA